MPSKKVQTQKESLGNNPCQINEEKKEAEQKQKDFLPIEGL